MKKSEFLTTGEVAKMCGVSYRTIIRWIDKGILVATRLPSRGDRRIHQKELERFLATSFLPSTPKKKTALVIEDEPFVAAAIARSLHLAGFETEIALTGIEAGMILIDRKPDLVTVDLKLKHSNGIDIIHLIRKNEGFKNVKILVISGATEPELENAVASGADHSLAKPFSQSELREKLKALSLLEGESHDGSGISSAA